jgi:hypothetical protein
MNSVNKHSEVLHKQLDWGYQPKSNFVKVMVICSDSYKIFNRWKKHSQSLNVRSVSDVRQIEIHAAEQIVRFS